MKKAFEKAKPVWLAGKSKEANCCMRMTCCFSGKENSREADASSAEMELAIATAGIYRVYLNGSFLGHGPARAAHGYFRQDRIALPQNLLSENNILAVEALNFYTDSYYVPKQEAFVQAELRKGDRVLACTGEGGGFLMQKAAERVQDVPRYSFQRPWTESFRLEEGYDLWRTQGIAEPEAIEVFSEKKILPRHVPWYDFPVLEQEAAAGMEVPQENTRKEMPLEEGASYIADMGKNATGFLGVEVRCEENACLELVFDEVLSEGDVCKDRLGCLNELRMEFEPGHYCVETIQPYTCRYIKPIAREGKLTVERIYIRELKNTCVKAEFCCDDEAVNRVYQAGVETFAQNAVDIYMDCPSRERAGWLCDSFFTGRVEWELTGKHLVEDNFLENYCLPETFACLPEGMVPMCYPSDHFNGNFIANWALWLILELYEYQGRKPETALTEGLKKRVEGIFRFLEQYEGPEGLLEDVPGWVFVEWSQANEVTAGVNFPSNMVYSAAYLAASCLYDVPRWREKGMMLREKIQELSFDGEWFRDQALRQNGGLMCQDCVTEVCQYYAFFFGVADKKRNRCLFERLLNEFGPDRQKEGKYPEVWPANAFIGNYLRMELLSKEGRAEQLLQETKGYFDYMALRTGTLWENTGAYASCNHGFASHITHCLYRDVLGVEEITEKKVRIRLHRLSVCFCRGVLPANGGSISVEWRREGDKVYLHTELPDGFEAEVLCEDGLQLA